MKTFTTEQKLFEFKYQNGGHYFGKLLAEIFFEELIRFNTGRSPKTRLPLQDAIKPYFHRYENNLCEVKFSDNSMLLIRFDESGNYQSCGIFEGNVYGHIIDYSIE